MCTTYFNINKMWILASQHLCDLWFSEYTEIIIYIPVIGCILPRRRVFYTGCPKKIVPFFIYFFLGAQCVESGESCTDCY
jgi:hypothetical protein